MTARRALIAWGIGFAALIAAFVLTITILNATAYSAHGFVKSYFDALNRHDTATALKLPGVTEPKGEPASLMTDAALGSITNIHLVSDTTDSRGVHDVKYSYDLGSKPGTTDFRVERDGSFFGLFHQWRFTKSPVATVALTVLHDPRFRVNGSQITPTAKQNAAAKYAVFAPGLYSFDHKSDYLTASTVKAAVTRIGSVTPVQVDVQANRQFVADVQSELKKYLAGCAKQTVLLPTSCPFGKTFNNRVVSTPAWSMVSYPKVTIVPDPSTGNWLVPSTQSTAHLKVQVQSLLTGVVGTFDEDVPFPVSFRIVIGPADHLTITSLYG